MGCGTAPDSPVPVASSVERVDSSQGQLLTAPEPSQVGSFGVSLAVAGDTLLVGATDANLGGSVYVFARGSDGWVDTQRLVASNGHRNDEFGQVVALAGDTALFGAPEDTGGGEYAGAAYVFERSGSTFTQSQKLEASDAAASAYFGKAVALEDDTLLVGSNQGAYVFTRYGSGWQEQQKLTNADAFEFGSSVALEGDTALVGSDGEVDVFSRDGASFMLSQRLTPSDGQNQYFGENVALAGDWVLIGARLDASNNLSRPGSAYLFERNGKGFDFSQKLTSHSGEGDWFGDAVALSGDLALVGADYASNGGTAYLFLRGAHGWQEEQSFAGGDASDQPEFGSALALDDRDAVVGAWSTRVQGFGQAGVAYAYSLPAPSGSAGAPGEEPPSTAGAPGTPPETASGAGGSPDTEGQGAAEPGAPSGAGSGDETPDPANAAADSSGGGQAGAPGVAACGQGDAACARPSIKTVTHAGCSIGPSVELKNSPACSSWLTLLAGVAVLGSRRRRRR
jgi:MYXO-CTERM domain-containing protein